MALSINMAFTPGPVIYCGNPIICKARVSASNMAVLVKNLVLNFLVLSIAHHPFKQQ
jgi:hypothetical protein